MIIRSRFLVVSESASDDGKSSMILACGICGLHTSVRIWSFYGSGRRCPQCTAMMDGGGWSTLALTKSEKTAILNDLANTPNRTLRRLKEKNFLTESKQLTRVGNAMFCVVRAYRERDVVSFDCTRGFEEGKVMANPCAPSDNQGD